MAHLFAYLSSVFAGFVSILAALIGQRAAFAAVVIAAYLFFLGGLWTAIQLLLGGIATALPSGELSDWLFVGFNLALPENWEVCVSAMLSADVLVFIYRFNQNKVVAAAAQ